MSQLGIPTVYAEIKYPSKTTKKGKSGGLSQLEGRNSEFNILAENNRYLEYTYEKLGT